MNITIPIFLLFCALVCELIATFKPNWLPPINWMTFGFAFIIASWLFTGALTVVAK